jgi:hypothetical protein
MGTRGDDLMIKTLQLTGARANDDATDLTLTAVDRRGKAVEINFDESSAENLLIAFASVLGHRYRQRSKDATGTKVIPTQGYWINREPDGDGLLMMFRVLGGMEITFHLPAKDVPHFEEVLSTLTGTRQTSRPPRPTN